MTRPNKKSLPQIAREIKTLEKRSIKDAIEIGKLLHEAEDQCEHGTYMEWLETEFDFSYSTSLNYRNAYAFSQKHNSCDYGKLNISLGAFYLLADLEDKATISAIIKAAKNGRVSRSIAQDIVDKLDEPPPITPRKPPPIEPLDGEEDGADDEASIVPDNDEALSGAEERLFDFLVGVLEFTPCSPAWPKVVLAIGQKEVAGIVETLNAVLNQVHGRSAVQSTADRAEARSRMTAKMLEKESSDG